MTESMGHNRQLYTDRDALREYLDEQYADELQRANDLTEALGRMPDAVDDDDGAGKAADFIKQITACVKHLETARKSEKEPYLEGGRMVDAAFAKHKDGLDGVKKEVNRRLTVYLRAKEEAERAAREKAEREAREVAAKAARAAAEAEAAIREEEDLANAVELERAAKQAAADAEKARKESVAKSADMSRTRGDYGGVTSLVERWEFADLDRHELDLEALRHHLPSDALEKAVRSFIKAGGRELAGVHIFLDKKSRVA